MWVYSNISDEGKKFQLEREIPFLKYLLAPSLSMGNLRYKLCTWSLAVIITADANAVISIREE